MNAQNSDEPIQNDSGYCKFGAEALLNLLAVFRKQIEGVVKNEDPEFVHKTRRITSYNVCYTKLLRCEWMRKRFNE